MNLQPTSEGTSYLGRKWIAVGHGVEANLSCTLDVTKFTAVDGVIEEGTALSYDEATELYVPYDSADVAAKLDGFLFNAVGVPANADATTVAFGARLIHGAVIEAGLPDGPLSDAAKADVPQITFV